MSVSKRTRFEVLRRDEHTCQYCGQMAPDVTLHVDHVIPVALGGSDKPDNLVTACKDCNLGKASIAPDSPLVSAIGTRSAEYAIATANRRAHLSSDMSAMLVYEEAFTRLWESFTTTIRGEKMHLPLPQDWRSTLSMWWKTSVPEELISSAIQTAMDAKSVNHDDRFRYFCGIIWRTLDEYDLRYPEQTAEARVYSEAEAEEILQEGWSQGFDSARARARAESVAL